MRFSGQRRATLAPSLWHALTWPWQSTLAEANHDSGLAGAPRQGLPRLAEEPLHSRPGGVDERPARPLFGNRFQQQTS